jgi:hypothetical protein
VTGPQEGVGDWEWEDLQACLLSLAEKRSACNRVLQDGKYIAALK